MIATESSAYSTPESLVPPLTPDRLRALPPAPARSANANGPPTLLRLSAGFVYFFFGFLKLFPDLSPAELIAGETLTRVTGHQLSAATALWWLALMETTVGLGFLLNFKLHLVFPIFISHQICTFLPLFIVPELCFKFAPFAPTMEGQYILKNLVTVAVGLTVMLPAVRNQWLQVREKSRQRRALNVAHAR